MIKFLDGPAAGITLELLAAPEHLAVVQAQDGTWDALDQPGDNIRPGETLYWYERIGRGGIVHIDYYDRVRRRRAGKTLARADYRYERGDGRLIMRHET